MTRNPVVAGRFYPGSGQALEGDVRAYLAQAKPRSTSPTILAMAPHAGYVFSGPVAGRVLGQANLADTIILLGPNHTGLGQPLAVWSQGNWLCPLGEMAVDSPLATALLGAEPRLQADQTAHLREHSLEVMVPFLWVLKKNLHCVPIAVSEPRLPELLAVARNMAQVLKSWPSAVSILVSSDMSHYLPQDQTTLQDAKALESMTRLDPAGLYDVVRREGISMCGVLPMVLGLAVAKELGATKAEVASYATSGDVSGDYAQVVGYAGVLVS